MRTALSFLAFAASLVVLPVARADLATLQRIDPSFVDELQVLSRRDVLAQVTDRINPTTAMHRYLGDFDGYWSVTRSSRTGKFAEAQVALGYRRFAELNGHDYFISPTALKNPAAPFDLVVTNGKIAEKTLYQMKLGEKASIDALDDARYAGGKILCPQDTLSRIRSSVTFESEKAARRGLALEPRWQAAKDAIETERLTDTLPGGYQVASRSDLTCLAERFYRREFKNVAMPVLSEPATSPLAFGTVEAAEVGIGLRVASEAEVGERLLKSSSMEFGGRIVGVAGAGLSLYKGVGDYERYKEGRIDAVGLSQRWASRGIFGVAGVYAAVASGPAAWLVGAGVVGGEMLYDHYDQIEDARFQETLKTLEATDRREAALAAVLRDYHR